MDAAEPTTIDPVNAADIAARAAAVAPGRYRNIPWFLLLPLSPIVALVAWPLLLKLRGDDLFFEGYCSLACGLPAVVLLGAWFISRCKTVTVDAQGLRLRNGWGDGETLAWPAIAMLRSDVGGYSVGSSGGTYIPLLGAGHGQALLAEVRRVRPDLWQRFAGRVLKVDERTAFQQAMAWMCLLIVPWQALAQLLNERYFLALVFVGLTPVGAWALLHEPLSAELEAGGVRIRYRRSQRFVPRQDIAGFLPQRSGGVLLIHHAGRPIDLGLLEGGSAYGIDKLRAWLGAPEG